ncbi:hypothetical protein L218DRAFT_842876, partial [Marasmius fiardii PR-910]
PEPPVYDRFNQDDLTPFIKSISLNGDWNANRDIRITLDAEFQKIASSQRCSHMIFPKPWPARSELEMLVDKASGQYIYAITITRFVGLKNADSREQLKVILGLPSNTLSSNSTSPYSDLDVLYQHILMSATGDRAKLLSVMSSILLLRQVESATPCIIEHLLDLGQGELNIILQQMHSPLDIQGPEEEIVIYHTSFIDFL